MLRFSTYQSKISLRFRRIYCIVAAGNNYCHRFQQDFNILLKGDVLYIFAVIGQFLIPATYRAAVDLSKSGEARTDIVAVALLFRVVRQVAHQQGPGADDGHIALEDVPKLRQLVKAGGAEGMI